MKLRTSLILFLLAVVISVFNAIDYVRITDEKEKSSLRDLLVPVDASKVGFISIERNKKKPVTFLKSSNNEWAVVEPVRDMADGDVIRDIMAFISFGRGELVKNISLEDAGLVNPTVRMGVSEKAGKVGLSILFGKQDAEKNIIYAAREFEEDKIYTIDTDLVSFLFKSADLFRDRAMVGSGIKDAQKIILQGTASGQIVFSRSANGWNMEEPVAWPADNAALEKLLHSCMELRSSGILAEKMDDLDSIGLGEDSVAVSFATTDRVYSLRLAPSLGEEPGKGLAYNISRAPVFEINDQLRKDILRRDASYYRKKHLELLASLEKMIPDNFLKGADEKISNQKQVALLMQGIKEISVASKNETMRISNEKIAWKGISPKVFLADYGELMRLIAETRDLDVESFLDSEEQLKERQVFGLDVPEISFSLTGFDSKIITQLFIGKKSGKNSYYARTYNSPEIFELSSHYVALLNRKWFKFNQKAVCSFGLQDAQKLSIWRNGSEFTYQRTAGDSWQMTSPETIPADAWGLYTGPLSKKNGIGELIALDIIGEVKEDLTIFGLENPFIRVICEYNLPDFAKAYSDRDKVVVHLEIGKAVKYKGKTAYCARLKKGNVVFLIPERVVESLDKNYGDRKLLN